MADQSASQATKVLVASLIGSSIEWYDYLLYGTVAPLVFVSLFFPTTDPVNGLLLTYVTFALPFFVRPLGGVIFSHSVTSSGARSRWFSRSRLWALRRCSSAVYPIMPPSAFWRRSS